MSGVSAITVSIQCDLEPTLETRRGLEKGCTACAAEPRAVSAKVRSYADQLAACKDNIRELKRVSDTLRCEDVLKAAENVTTGSNERRRIDGEEKP